MHKLLSTGSSSLESILLAATNEIVCRVIFNALYTQVLVFQDFKTKAIVTIKQPSQRRRCTCWEEIGIPIDYPNIWMP